MFRRLLGVIALAILVVYVAKHPTQSATGARSLGHALIGVADGIGNFISQLIGR